VSRPANRAELEEQISQVTGSTPAARAASEAVRALVKAARSVLLYDASNEAVRDFLVDVRRRIEEFQTKHGALVLTMRPWEILFDGEVVYAEKDRERSLAIRLYRDGVRGLTIAADAPWDEVSRLVSILSLRFKGIRQQEEDFVTLLWKAAFTGIGVEAVAGFVEEDEDEQPDYAAVGEGEVAPRNATQAAIFAAPYAFDHPWPDLLERGQVNYRPLDDAARRRLLAEDGEDHLPSECHALVRELIAAMRGGTDAVPAADIVPLVREIRDYLLNVGRLDSLLELGWMVRARVPEDPDDGRRELLLACFDERALRRLAAAPEELWGAEASRKLGACLLAEHLGDVLGLLDAGPPVRPEVVQSLLASLSRGREALLRGRLPEVSDRAAGGLLGVIFAGSPEEGVQAATDLLVAHRSGVEAAAVGILRTAPYGPRVGRALLSALDSNVEEVRLQALQVLVKNRERRVFAPLTERLGAMTGSRFSPKEANAYGISLAMLDPAQALKLFHEWVRPSGLLQRVAPRQPALLWAAAGGLSRLGGAEAEALLEWMSAHVDEELAARCRAFLAQRRQAGDVHSE
jgi:hypothetical protein